MIGFATKMLLNALLDEGDILQEDANKFHKAVRGFEIEALNYSKTRLPIKDDVVKHARFLNVQRRLDTNFDDVLYFVHR